jgi:putative ABC transport system permease protein
LTFRWSEQILRDIRFALRTWRRSPAFTAVAVLTLALGVGLNTAIFSVVEAVLLKQLPYRDPERVVALAVIDAATPGASGVGGWAIHEWRIRSRSFESVSTYGDTQRTLVKDGQAEVLRGMAVDDTFFDTLGVRMWLGRSFLPEENRWPRANVVILSHSLWVRRFGADAQIVGRVVQFSDVPVRIVGVLPADFHPLRMSNPAETPQIFMPQGYDPDDAVLCRSCGGGRAIARLKPGVSAGRARTELNGIMRDIVREYPADYARDATVRVEPLRDQLIGPVHIALWILLGAVVFVLLIACANVASLQLARATARSRELALRAALGGGRWRLAGQLLIESLLLASAGGAAGVLLGLWGTAAIVSWAPRELPRLDEIGMDARVLLFGLGISLVTGFLFGMAPAWSATRVDLNDALKRTDTRPGRSDRHGLRNLLVIAEVALAFVLVVATGLLGKSFVRLTAVDPGFDPHNVLTLTPTLQSARYRTPQARLQYFRQLVERVRAVPGIVSVGMISNVPLSHSEPEKVRVDNRPAVSDAHAPSADVFWVSPDYFRVLEIPLKRGRFLTDRDGVDTPPVVLVSESFARARFLDTDPIGHRIQLGSQQERGPWLAIVGIVGNVRHEGLDHAPNEALYLPQAMNPFHYTRLVARTAGDPWRFEGAVRAVIREIDSTQPVFHVQPMDDYVAASLAERTFTLELIGLFGILALVLAGVGIYGLISYTVGLRTREIGIRFALGAQRSVIMRMVLQDVLELLGWGFAAGLIAALALTRFLSHLLYQVRPTDVTTTASVAVVLGCVALLAGCVPALRAVAVDPSLALRSE